MGDDSYTITIGKATGGLSYVEPTYNFDDLIAESDTITIDTSTYNINDSVISNGTNIGYTITEPEAHNVYDINEIEEMCSEYPALAKAYENFRTMYDMVLQDYKGKQND